MPLTHTGAVVIVLAGTAGIVASGGWVWSIENFRETATRTTGRVTEVVYDFSSSSESGATYKPRFQFTTPDGKVWTVTSSNGSSPALYSVGDRVTVLYDPANPAQARINSVTQLWTGPVVFGIFAAVVIFIGMQALLAE